MTARTLDLGVNALERIAGKLFVVESLDLESVGDVAGLTRPLGRGETKLPSMHVTMATPALTWRATIRSPFAALPVLLRGAVATVAGCFRVGPGQWPGAVIDPG